jgi:choline kinase
MKAIILAAGTGGRLGDVGKQIPKCLIKLGKKTIIEYQIEALQSNNINDVSVVTGYYADKVKDLLKNTGIKFYLNKDYEKTGMLESLFCAKEELNDDIVVLYGDVIFNADLIKRLLEDKNDFCLIVDREKEITHGAESAVEEYHGEKIRKGSTNVNIVEGVVKKISKTLLPEEISAEYIGIAKFSKKAVQTIYQRVKEIIDSGEVKKYPSLSYLFRWLIDNGNDIHAVYTDGLLYEEIDYEEDLEKAKRKFD